LDCPLSIALARNAKRSWSVPESVIRKMAKNFEPPQKEEGFFVWRIPCKNGVCKRKLKKKLFPGNRRKIQNA